MLGATTLLERLLLECWSATECRKGKECSSAECYWSVDSAELESIKDKSAKSFTELSVATVGEGGQGIRKSIVNHEKSGKGVLGALMNKMGVMRNEC